MSIITLSSETFESGVASTSNQESDFTNHFPRGITIPPNSEVCLLQFACRDMADQVEIVERNRQFGLRTGDAQEAGINYAQLPIGKYKLEEFATILQTALNDACLVQAQVWTVTFSAAVRQYEITYDSNSVPTPALSSGVYGDAAIEDFNLGFQSITINGTKTDFVGRTGAGVNDLSLQLAFEQKGMFFGATNPTLEWFDIDLLTNGYENRLALVGTDSKEGMKTTGSYFYREEVDGFLFSPENLSPFLELILDETELDIRVRKITDDGFVDDFLVRRIPIATFGIVATNLLKFIVSLDERNRKLTIQCQKNTGAGYVNLPAAPPYVGASGLIFDSSDATYYDTPAEAPNYAQYYQQLDLPLYVAPSLTGEPEVGATNAPTFSLSGAFNPATRDPYYALPRQDNQDVLIQNLKTTDASVPYASMSRPQNVFISNFTDNFGQRYATSLSRILGIPVNDDGAIAYARAVTGTESTHVDTRIDLLVEGNIHVSIQDLPIFSWRGQTSQISNVLAVVNRALFKQEGTNIHNEELIYVPDFENWIDVRNGQELLLNQLNVKLSRDDGTLCSSLAQISMVIKFREKK